MPRLYSSPVPRLNLARWTGGWKANVSRLLSIGNPSHPTNQHLSRTRTRHATARIVLTPVAVPRLSASGLS